MNLLTYPKGEKFERAAEMARPLTPMSDRRYEGRIAPVGVPGRGCWETVKCVRPEGHGGRCWPE